MFVTWFSSGLKWLRRVLLPLLSSPTTRTLHSFFLNPNIEVSRSRKPMIRELLSNFVEFEQPESSETKLKDTIVILSKFEFYFDSAANSAGLQLQCSFLKQFWYNRLNYYSWSSPVCGQYDICFHNLLLIRCCSNALRRILISREYNNFCYFSVTVTCLDQEESSLY